MVGLKAHYNNYFNEYPLKVVAVNDFFPNMNELLWGRVSKESLINDHSEHNKYKTKLNNFEFMQRNQMIKSFSPDRSSSSRNQIQIQKADAEGRSEEIIVFFVDTGIYREQFENSKIKNIKNIVILNR